MTELTKRGTPRKRQYVANRAPRGESRLDRVKRHAKVDSSTGCWVWQLSLDDAGYGRMTIDGNASFYAHRVSYEEHVGPIPSGLTIDHLCRNRACVNPAHLEPVTVRVNNLRGFGVSGVNARKTHCPRGHLYDEGNTYRHNGRRYCIPCRDDYLATYLVTYRRRSA